jgi:hypothetical protein
MLESTSTLWARLEEGTCLHVCGDTPRMAKDVDAALRQVIQQPGARIPDQAAQHINHLRATHRKCREVLARMPTKVTPQPTLGPRPRGPTPGGSASSTPLPKT